MLIRSQDKKTIANLDNIAEMISDYDIRAFYGWECIILGVYTTKEKAIKVLDMIQKKYLETTEICQGDYSVRYIQRAVVFQMPQDNEV